MQQKKKIKEPYRWPEGSVVYHVYLRSLQDTNGDGIGDLPGLIQRLDYIKGLGVTALWLSPFYVSPMIDFGYDIADYQNVDPLFGTIDDFKTLLSEAQKRQIKVIIDLVPNHTSDQHAWFQKSRTSKHDPHADWYIWRDGRKDPAHNTILPPNNWLDAWSGHSAWQWDDMRKQFYLHSFHISQPDLNWNNEAVRRAMKDVMRFWLDIGVDGFRVDAVYWMAKDPLFRDDDSNPDYIPGEDHNYLSLKHNKSRGWPAIYAYLTEMAEVLQEEKYSDRLRFMVTEAYAERHNPVATYLTFYAGMDPKVAAPFNFEGVELDWEASAWHRFLRAFHLSLSEFSDACIPIYAFGNHDNSRLVSRIGEAAARSAAVMQLTLPGMVVIYYGEEIGMVDVKIPQPFIHDPSAVDNKWGKDRDQFRTPMQWSSEKNAGFTSADQPWLPISPHYAKRNVAIESDDPYSFLSLYRRLCSVRNKSVALRRGSIEVLDMDEPHVLAFRRQKNKERYITLVNFSNELVVCRPDFVVGKFVLSSDPQTKLAQSVGKLELLPYEGALFKL